MLGLNEPFPGFKLPFATGDAIGDIDNSIQDKWAVVFFYPADNTPICASEVMAFQKMYYHFEDRDCAVMGVSCDSIDSHTAWLNKIGYISFPLASDSEHAGLSYQLGILEDGKAQRATYIIDPAGIIRWVSVHDKLVGRSITEVLRVLDALQSGELCECAESESKLDSVTSGYIHIDKSEYERVQQEFKNNYGKSTGYSNFIQTDKELDWQKIGKTE